MKYLHTMVRVADLDAARWFYCDLLGLVEVSRIDNAAGRFSLIFLSAAEDASTARTERSPLLELTHNWPTSDGASAPYTQGRNFGHLAFRVDDIHATCSRIMDAGVVINRPPRDGHMAFVRLPDGISIELLQAGESLEPSEPWLSMPNTGTW